MSIWQQALIVGSAGFCGAILRWLLTLISAQVFATRFPVATLFINVSGSFALGYLMATLAHRTGPSEALRLAIGVGFLGAYTTFSTWMYDCDALFRQGLPASALLNLSGSIILGLLAVRFGYWLGVR